MKTQGRRMSMSAKSQGKMWMLACGLAGMLGVTTAARAAEQPSGTTAPSGTTTAPSGTTGPSGTTLRDPVPGDNPSEGAAAPGSAPQAGVPAPTPAPPTAKLPVADHQAGNGQVAVSDDPTWIAVKLHRVNLMEIKAGKAEQAKGVSPRVKSLASQIVRDQQMADRQLAAYAKKRKISLNGSESGPVENNDNIASSEDQDDLQMQADLRALKAHKGRDMDQAFLTTVIVGHDKAIELVRGARQATKDTELATLLDQVLPSLQGHRDSAATLNNAINGTSSR